MPYDDWERERVIYALGVIVADLQGVLKTFPGPGYLHSENETV